MCRVACYVVPLLILSASYLTSFASADQKSEMANTCILPDKLTVSYVLANTAPVESDTNSPVSEPEVHEFLAGNGVALTEADETADRQAAFHALTKSSDFWVKHHSLHPNRSRVKNWLWVHSRYRDQASAIVKSANEISNQDDPKVVQTSVKKVLADFNKFAGKIKSHSEFEDTQLFKFFVEEDIGSSAETLTTLMEQHSDIKQVSEIQDICQNILADPASGDAKGELTTKISAYVKDLEAHLENEEHTIVALWLQLTPTQYKKYRSYLSWKYAMMY